VDGDIAEGTAKDEATYSEDSKPEEKEKPWKEKEEKPAPHQTEDSPLLASPAITTDDKWVGVDTSPRLTKPICGKIPIRITLSVLITFLLAFYCSVPYACGYYLNVSGWWMMFAFPFTHVAVAALLVYSFRCCGISEGEGGLSRSNPWMVQELFMLALCFVALAGASLLGLALGVHASNMMKEVDRIDAGGLDPNACPSGKAAGKNEKALWWTPGSYVDTTATPGVKRFNYDCRCSRYGCDTCYGCVTVVPVMAPNSGTGSCTPSNKINYWAYRGQDDGNCKVPKTVRGAVISRGQEGHHTYLPPICKGSDSYSDGLGFLEADINAGKEIDELKKAKQVFLNQNPKFSDSPDSRFVFMCQTPWESAQDAKSASINNYIYTLCGSLGIVVFFGGIIAAALHFIFYK